LPKAKDFLDRFKGTLHLDFLKEQKFERDIAEGKKKHPKHQYRFEDSMNVYQKPQYLRELEPQNVSKKRYSRQFGPSTSDRMEEIGSLMKRHSP